MHMACGISIHIPTIVWGRAHPAPSCTHFAHRLYTELSPLWTSYPPLCTHLSTLIMSNLVLAVPPVDKWMASNIAKNGVLDDSGGLERAYRDTSPVDNSSPFVDKLADLGITAVEKPHGASRPRIWRTSISLGRQQPRHFLLIHIVPEQYASYGEKVHFQPT